MDKIAFVCQRYGVEVNGGAEAECRAYAERLTAYYDVEVITTCALDYTTWKNHYPAGTEKIAGVTVRRFAVDFERSVEGFAKLSARVAGKEHRSRAEEQEWLRSQGPVAPAALDYLRAHAGEYKVVYFMTYLYYLTALGLPGFPGRAVLIPTAHDEWPIYFRHYREVFEAAHGYVYNSNAERRFVDRLFLETSGKPYITIGAGVEEPEGPLPDAAERFGLTGDYIVYAGRIDESKGCGELFAYFAAYKRRYGGTLKLVLMGKAVMPIPERDDIVPLGFVSEEEKFAVLKGAKALVLASHFESLSIVVLESMLMGRPVLVNGRCEVLYDHAVDSGAGLYFRSSGEFGAALHWLLNHEREYALMCENGRKYVARYYRWPHITEKLRALTEIIGN